MYLALYLFLYLSFVCLSLFVLSFCVSVVSQFLQYCLFSYLLQLTSILVSSIFVQSLFKFFPFVTLSILPYFVSPFIFFLSLSFFLCVPSLQRKFLSFNLFPFIFLSLDRLGSLFSVFLTYLTFLFKTTSINFFVQILDAPSRDSRFNSLLLGTYSPVLLL